jgi:hypothetical protein
MKVHIWPMCRVSSCWKLLHTCKSATARGMDLRLALHMGYLLFLSDKPALVSSCVQCFVRVGTARRLGSKCRAGS